MPARTCLIVGVDGELAEVPGWAARVPGLAVALEAPRRWVVVSERSGLRIVDLAADLPERAEYLAFLLGRVAEDWRELHLPERNPAGVREGVRRIVQSITRPSLVEGWTVL